MTSVLVARGSRRSCHLASVGCGCVRLLVARALGQNACAAFQLATDGPAPTPLQRLASSYAFHSTSSLSNSSTPAANKAAAKDTGAHASPPDALNGSLVDELRHPWPTILNRWQSKSDSLLIGLRHKHWHSTVLVSLALFLLILAARLALRGPGGLRCRRVESRRALEVASDGTAAS